MEVSFTFRQFEGTEELKSLIKGRLEKKLGVYVNGNPAEARVTISMEKAWTLLEIQVSVWGEVFKSSEKTTDLYPTIDVVVERLERQIQKRKEMFRQRRMRRA